jgi:putative ABC transport system substrate-binding protein
MGNLLIYSAIAAMAATTTIPIVFAGGADPVRFGLVASLGRPGGNVTGISYFTSSLNPKRLELIRELVPSTTVIGFLTNPTSVISEVDVADMQAAARGVGQDLHILKASTPDDIDAAFETMRQRQIGTLIVSGDTLLVSRRSQLAVLAARHGIATSFPSRDYVVAGGLMSYGDNRLESMRQTGVYTGRILKGEKPADLPVLQPTKFEFVINLRTAKVLGITFPPSFHLRADEVIE